MIMKATRRSLWVMLLALWAIGSAWPAAGSASEVSATARMLPSGDGIELEYQADGETWTDILPLHRSGNLRYFSAGVGMGERRAQYPPFPLKIVLTAGGKPFLAHVDVHLVQQDGPLTLSIPAEHVTGPWLFVDLPPGVYEITGNKGSDKPRLGSVKVSASGVRTVYLRFAEDPAP